MHKAVFLDKDGTLIENVPYNIDPAKIKLTRGCERGLKLLHEAGYKLIVISNQPGIAKGYFTFKELKKAEETICTMTDRFGVPLSSFYYCPHHPEGSVEAYSISCTCRKPEAGMILKAASEHEIDLQSSWLIGDILNDIEAGKKAGCRTILIDNGNETEWIITPRRTPDFTVFSMEGAAKIIIAA